MRSTTDSRICELSGVKYRRKLAVELQFYDPTWNRWEVIDTLEPIVAMEIEAATKDGQTYEHDGVRYRRSKWMRS